jgi:hypothetical protein
MKPVPSQSHKVLTLPEAEGRPSSRGGRRTDATGSYRGPYRHRLSRAAYEGFNGSSLTVMQKEEGRRVVHERDGRINYSTRKWEQVKMTKPCQ